MEWWIDCLQEMLLVIGISKYPLWSLLLYYVLTALCFLSKKCFEAIRDRCKYRNTEITFSIENTGILWQIQCSIKGFCCLFRSWIQYFYISAMCPSSVCHCWNTPHLSSSLRGENLFLKGCSFVFMPWTSLLLASIYKGSVTIYLFLSSHNPLVEVFKLQLCFLYDLQAKVLRNLEIS